MVDRNSEGHVRLGVMPCINCSSCTLQRVIQVGGALAVRCPGASFANRPSIKESMTTGRAGGLRKAPKRGRVGDDRLLK